MSDQQFAELLAGAQDGDATAVTVLWRAHHPHLLRFLRTRHHQQDVDDIASDVWIRVTRNVHRFRGDESDFRAWFFSIARATSVDWYRKVGRRREALADEIETRVPFSTADAATGAFESLGTDHAIALLARLPTDQAEAIALRVIAGLDAESVSRIMGKRPGNVRVLQHRGLQRLAQLLAQDSEIGADVTP
jgi:RNA polymerase sigma-70 factor (ECF subfamily)